MNQPERREVSALQRASVLEALKDSDGYRIYKSGRIYLRRVGFDPLQVAITDLVDYLEAGHRLYIFPDDPRKCQCCLRYEDNLIVYAKITPSDDGGRLIVLLDFHSHNTGHPPLPS